MISPYRGIVTIVPRRNHPEDDETAVVVYQDPETGVVDVHVEGGAGRVKIWRDDAAKGGVVGTVYDETTEEVDDIGNPVDVVELSNRMSRLEAWVAHLAPASAELGALPPVAPHVPYVAPEREYTDDDTDNENAGREIRQRRADALPAAETLVSWFDLRAAYVEALDLIADLIDEQWAGL